MTKHRFATEEIEKFSTVDLIAELKRRYQVLSRPERSCVLVGSTHSGVSTQAGFLHKEWGLCRIKRSDILPNPESDLHEAVNKLSDEIGSFRCRRGFVVEHFPENKEEASMFDSMLSKSHGTRPAYTPILLSMPSATEDERKASLDLVNKRAAGHMIHPSSGRVYNSSVPDLSPQVANTDDVTGEPLVCPRKDFPSIAKEALEWWTRREPEIKAYFGSRLKQVDSSLNRDDVSIEVSKVLLDAGSK